jgi:hypothetical protein
MDKSTGSEPFLKLDPDTKPMTDSPAGAPTGGDPKIYSDTPDATYTGMKIVPLNPDAKTSNTSATPASTTTETTAITDKAGVSDQVWKDTPLDDISRSGAPGSGPKGPAHVTPAAPDSTATTSTATTTADSAIKTSAPDSVTASSDKYAKSSSLTNPTDSLRDTPEWTSTGVSPNGGEHLEEAKKAEATKAEVTKTTDSSSPATATATASDSKTGTWMQKTRSVMGGADGVAGIAEDKTARKSESGKSPELSTTTSNDEKNGKMSHLKEKMKNKLHIGSKDK